MERHEQLVLEALVLLLLRRLVCLREVVDRVLHLVDRARHGEVLVRPLARALAAAGVGAFALQLPWPVPVLGATAMAVGAGVALRAVWRWDRTRLVVTTEKLVLEEGVVRRRESTVLLRAL